MKETYPTVTIHVGSEFSKMPYQVVAHPQEMARYMQARGLRRKLIRTMDIQIREEKSKEELRQLGKSEDMTVRGDYNCLDNTTRIYMRSYLTDLDGIRKHIIPSLMLSVINSQLEKLLSVVPSSAEAESYVHDMSSAIFVNPQRIEKYLMIASPKRALETLDRLALIRANREVNEVFFHEIEHAYTLDKVFALRLMKIMKALYNVGITPADTINDFLMKKVFAKSLAKDFEQSEIDARATQKPNKRNIGYTPFTISRKEVQA